MEGEEDLPCGDFLGREFDVRKGGEDIKVDDKEMERRSWKRCVVVSRQDISRDSRILHAKEFS